MNILIAPDKFKNSLTAIEVCEAIEEAWRESGIEFKSKLVPMADGGEGTCEMLTTYSKGSNVKVKVVDPFFREIEAEYGLSHDGETAFIEMASASGLQLLKVEERNPLDATTFGTGQLIAYALNRGVKEVILGIGGSATNDAGIGMGAALGVKFYSMSKDELKPIGRNLINIQAIDSSKIHPAIKVVSFTALCDVDNPLYGPQGAAYVFAPQKGADAVTVKLLDNGLHHFWKIVRDQWSIDINFPGAGAGGGLSAGAKAFFNIQFQPGIDFLMKFIHLEDTVKWSHLVITGEGKVDHQTLTGKVVKGVADLARKHRKPVFIVAGRNDLPENTAKQLGAQKIITLSSSQADEKQSMEHAFSLIKQRVKEEIIPLFLSPSQH